MVNVISIQSQGFKAGCESYRTNNDRPAGTIEYLTTANSIRPWRAYPWSVMDRFDFQSRQAAEYFLLACAIEDEARD